MARLVRHTKTTFEKPQSLFTTFSCWKESVNALPTAAMSSYRQTKNSSEGRGSVDCPNVTNAPTFVTQQSTENQFELQYKKLKTEHVELTAKHEEL